MNPANFSQNELGEYTTTIGKIILSEASPKASTFFSNFVENMIIQIIHENEMIDLDALFLMACHANNEYLINSLLKMEASMEAQTAAGETPIMLVTHRGNLNALQHFVNRGANIYAQTTNGRTVMSYAANGTPVYAYLTTIFAERMQKQEEVAAENQRLKDQLLLLQSHAGQINQQEYMALKTELLALQSQLSQSQVVEEADDYRRKIRKNEVIDEVIME